MVRPDRSIQARPSSYKVDKKKGESSQGGHRCGASHRVFGGKISEWSSRDRENSVVRVKMISVYFSCLGFGRSYI